MHADDFRNNLYGLVSALSDGGYSDDMTLAAIAGIIHYSFLKIFKYLMWAFGKQNSERLFHNVEHFSFFAKCKIASKVWIFNSKNLIYLWLSRLSLRYCERILTYCSCIYKFVLCCVFYGPGKIKSIYDFECVPFILLFCL